MHDLSPEALRTEFESSTASGAALELWYVSSTSLLSSSLSGSKLVVLEMVALMFGDAVHLGGFYQVTLLIITLMLVRAGVRRLVVR